MKSASHASKSPSLISSLPMIVFFLFGGRGQWFLYSERTLFFFWRSRDRGAPFANAIVGSKSNSFALCDSHGICRTESIVQSPCNARRKNAANSSRAPERTRNAAIGKNVDEKEGCRRYSARQENPSIDSCLIRRLE